MVATLPSPAARRSAFLGKGGLLESERGLTPLLRQFRQVAAGQIREAVKHAQSRGHSVDIRFGYFRDSELNGASTRVGSEYLVGLSQNLEGQLRELFAPLVTTGKLVTHVPLPRGASVRGEDTHERILTNYLCHWCVRFLLDHELAHIMNGHLDYLASDDMRSKQLPVMHYQALEMDADCSAVSRALTTLVRQVESGLWTPRAALFLWSFATYVLFRHRSSSGPIFEEMHRHKHAPAQLRGFATGAMLIDCLNARRNGKSPIPFSDGAAALLEAAAEKGEAAKAAMVAEIALAQASGEPFDPVPLEQAIHEEARHLLLVEHKKYWNEVRPHLRQHAYTSLAL